MITRPSAAGCFALPRLSELRHAALLSQRDLARRAGVTQQTIVRLEQGQAARPVTIRKIATALELTPSELLKSAEEDGEEAR